jgi:hypothetical protein
VRPKLRAARSCSGAGFAMCSIHRCDFGAIRGGIARVYMKANLTKACF